MYHPFAICEKTSKFLKWKIKKYHKFIITNLKLPLKQTKRVECE